MPRSPLHLSLVTASLALLSFGLANPLAAQSAQDIIDAALSALGAEKLAEIESVSRQGELIVDAGGTTLEGTGQLFVEPGKRLRRESDLGAAGSTTVWDGAEAWEDGAMGVRPIFGEELVLLVQESSLNTFFWLQHSDKETTIEKLDDTEIEGRVHHVVKISGAGMPAKTIEVDRETSLVTRETAELGVPGGVFTVIFRYSDYQTHEGVTLPGQIVGEVGDIYTSNWTLSSTQIGGPLGDDLFSSN